MLGNHPPGAKNSMTGKHTARYCNLAIVSLAEICRKEGGPGKLRSDWEEQIHIIDKRKADSPVYRVRPEGGRGKQESTTS